MTKRNFLLFLMAGIFAVLLISPAFSAQEPSVEPAELEPGVFIKSWYLLGPIVYYEGDGEPQEKEHIKEALQQAYIDEATENLRLGILEKSEIEIGEKTHKWAFYESKTGFINLNQALGVSSYSVAYAYAQITVPGTKDIILTIGADDGVMIYLNQELVFESYNVQRAIRDASLVPVSLKEGVNHILVKIQNSRDDWGFYLRGLDSSLINERFVKAAYQGNLDDVDLLLSFGADINATDRLGLTALHRAKIAGRKETWDYLLDKGADDTIVMPAREAILDAHYNSLFGEDTPGASILVARDGEILYHKGFGNADMGNSVPFTPNTHSRIGSITKQFTASAVLKMMEEGIITLDDRLSKFIPGFPRGDEVTVHHLLTHTSGIQSYTNKQEFTDKLLAETTNEEIINFIRDDEYNFDPGDSWLYNNSGYIILSHIIEKLTEKSLDEHLKETLFEPLGMKDTGIYKNRDILKNEAYGYSWENGAYKKALNWDMTWAGGAGALYSTVYDLYLWNEAVFSNKVLSPSSLELAFTPVTLNDGSTVDYPFKYGYGWVISEKRGLKEISHGGGLHGFNSELRRYTDINATVAVLQNSIPSDEGMSATELAEPAIDIFFWEDMAPQESYRTASEISRENWDSYAGQYNYGGIIMKIRRDGDRMFARLAFQQELEIFPRTADEFFWKAVDAQISFFLDEEGNVTHALHRQGGREIKAARITDNIEADIDRSVYKDYCGEYDFSSFIASIFRKDQSLFIQVAGQPELEIFPRSDREFFSDMVIIKLIFDRDAETGKMKIVLHQMGMKFEGIKTEN